MPARTLGLEGGGLWDPISVGEGNEAFFIRAWKPLLGQHLLAVGLDYYMQICELTLIGTKKNEWGLNWEHQVLQVIILLRFHISWGGE